MLVSESVSRSLVGADFLANIYLIIFDSDIVEFHRNVFQKMSYSINLEILGRGTSTGLSWEVSLELELKPPHRNGL